MDMNFTVRRAALKDLKPIQDLNHQLFLSDSRFDPELFNRWPYSPAGRKYFRRSLTEKRAGAWVAESRGKIIGYLVGWIWIKRLYRPVKTAELENMFVSPDYRSQGVGGALVKEFIKWCKKRQVKSVEVWAQHKNERGKQFYQTNGFAPARQMFELRVQ